MSEKSNNEKPRDAPLISNLVGENFSDTAPLVDTALSNCFPVKTNRASPLKPTIIYCEPSDSDLEKEDNSPPRFASWQDFLTEFCYFLIDFAIDIVILLTLAYIVYFICTCKIWKRFKF
ncbi:unnamed protein product [Caenorhabditis angaria]|uniref:Uncharacterized protein n=1 Tax=Caenorhabditis angaria TaxID=860376 RepID=A0A9P1J3S3_9PELO|nr:unnamed protein product [Caenorhabditis angaria]